MWRGGGRSGAKRSQRDRDGDKDDDQAGLLVFGFAVAEIDYVRPLDRPGRGWLWQFNLRPGY